MINKRLPMKKTRVLEAHRLGISVQQHADILAVLIQLTAKVQDNTASAAEVNLQAKIKKLVVDMSSSDLLRKKRILQLLLSFEKSHL